MRSNAWRSPERTPRLVAPEPHAPPQATVIKVGFWFAFWSGFWGFARQHPIAIGILILLVGDAVASVVRAFRVAIECK